MSQWEPFLYRGTHPAPPPANDPGYILNHDLANDAIHWLHTQEAVAPDRPYFLYFAPGGTHAPHHVPKDWIDKYRGQFDQGWDRLRGESFARQKKLGVIPADAELTPRPDGLPAWDLDGRRPGRNSPRARWKSMRVFWPRPTPRSAV